MSTRFDHSPVWKGVELAYCRVDEVGPALKNYRPSIIPGVPAVWRKLKDKITARLDAATGIRKWLIKWALTAKNPGLKRWLADRLVFSKIRRELGQPRLLLSGDAPVSADLIEFFKLIGLPLQRSV
jgi:long-subunit acyl-CoA synthetase (AMP-forming)